MVKDFRQPGPRSAEQRPDTPTKVSGARRQTVAGIYLSALIVALFGLGLLIFDQDFIPAPDAQSVAMLCFALAVADVVLVQYLKRIWRKQDER